MKSAFVVALLPLTLMPAHTFQAPAKVNFGRDVQPLLKEHCIGCHGPSQQMNGFRLGDPETRVRRACGSGKNRYQVVVRS